MNAAKMNYPIDERELLAIIHALRVWRQYLLGKPFKIVTDHHSLQYLMTQPNLSKREARWVEMVAEFDFEVVLLCPRRTVRHSPGRARRRRFPNCKNKVT